MVTPSRVKMNKLRHKHGMISKNRQVERQNKVPQEKISDEEHNKRLNKLKKMGLIK